MKILVLGGTRFFGKRLVRKLLSENHEVTIFSRGKTADDFGDRVHRLTGDRTVQGSISIALGNSRFDVVMDQTCMNGRQLKESIEALGGRTRFYILTSTQSVYSHKGNLQESDVEPSTYRPSPASGVAEEYAEGKRAAEHALVSGCPCPWAIVRIPVVLGEDDYTQRLKTHVEKVKNGRPIYFPNLEAQISFIHADDAANAILWLLQTGTSGVFNFAAPDPIRLQDLVLRIEQATSANVRLLSEPSEEHWSAFGVENDYWMNVDKAKQAGFQARPLSEWLQPLISHFAQETR